jgi:putative tryptophan/tyrosine transport system substrate-binding protein
VNRRTFIGRVAGGLLAVPFAVEAQQAGRLPRIGVLLPGNAGVGTESFSQGFRELGYIEGRTAVIEWRWWEGNTERLRDAAAEMRQLNLDVIVVGGSEATKGLEGSNPVNPDRISRAQLSGRGRLGREFRAARRQHHGSVAIAVRPCG